MKSTDARGESQVSLTGAKMQLELDDISVHYVWDGGDDDDKAQGVELDHVGLVVSISTMPRSAKSTRKLKHELIM